VLDMVGGLPRLVLVVALDNTLYNVNMLGNCGMQRPGDAPISKKKTVESSWCSAVAWDSRVSCHRSVVLAMRMR
jgi:hypothetical protein